VLVSQCAKCGLPATLHCTICGRTFCRTCLDADERVCTDCLTLQKRARGVVGVRLPPSRRTIRPYNQ
jgi:hypothetical protein